MARSPLSRNRRFERIAIPVLLVLFAVVAVRQLTGSDRRHCEERRVERVHRVHVNDGPRHERRHDREHRVEREVIVSVSN